MRDSEIRTNTLSGIKRPTIAEYIFETKEFWTEIAEELQEAKAILDNKKAVGTVPRLN